MLVFCNRLSDQGEGGSSTPPAGSGGALARNIFKIHSTAQHLELWGRELGVPEPQQVSMNGGGTPLHIPSRVFFHIGVPEILILTPRERRDTNH